MNAPSNLRHMFVAMLFALVVSEIAMSSYELFKTFGSSQAWWHQNAAGISHLAFALIVITTSWLGWSSTFRKVNESDQDKVVNVLDKRHGLLLMDVLIVILYFALVRSYDKYGESSLSAEAVFAALIFTAYAVWDLMHSNEKLLKRIEEMLPSAFVALLFWLAVALLPERLTTWWVVVGDVAGVALLVLYRLYKEMLEAKLQLETHW